MANLNDILSARENNMSQLAKYQRRVEEALQKGTMPNQTDINALNHYRYASNNRNKKYGDGKLKDIAKKEIASIKKDMDFNRKLLDNYTNSRTSQGGLIGQISQNSIESELGKLTNDLTERTKVLGGQYNNIGNITSGYTPTPSKAKIEEPSPEQETPKNDGGGGSKGGGGTRRYWNNSAVKQPEPTYVDQDGVTHTGMTQDEFNQSMQMYEADNQGWYEHQRNQTLPGGSTRGEIFDQAVEKFLANPDSFNDSQKQALIKVGQQLGYFNGSSTTAPDQTETQTVTDTVTIAPTVQPTVTPTPTQRQVNSAHDAYYAPQNNQWGITL